MTWVPRTYRTQVRVVNNHDGSFRVESAPHPVHFATVTHAEGTIEWAVRVGSDRRVAKILAYSESDALNKAAEVVGKLAGATLQVFTPQQRHSMGQGRCPYRLGFQVVCNRAPEVGTVWCEWHPQGFPREVPA